MPRYQATFTKTGSDSVRQLMELLSGATVQRIKVYAFTIGCVVSADNNFSYVVRRVTGSATGTALTPGKNDPNDAAARSSAKHLITADHASFNSSPDEVYRAPMNQRATFQWMSSEGRELVSAAVNANGISLGLSAVSTSQFEGTVSLEE